MYKLPFKTTFLTLLIATTLLLGTSSSALADQPRMKAALKALNNAEKQLEKASHDKGGHRIKALELIKEAKREVKKSIKYDRRH
jgi:uncharacterized membrane protein (DUF106 family)